MERKARREQERIEDAERERVDRDVREARATEREMQAARQRNDSLASQGSIEGDTPRSLSGGGMSSSPGLASSRSELL